MADVDYRTLVYTKDEINAQNTIESNRVDTAIALKLDSAEVGAAEGVAALSGGLLSVANIDWASNQDVMDATSDVKVMSPLRAKEAHEYYLQEAGGVTQVSNSIAIPDTLNIIPAKIDFFDTNCVSLGSHFTVDAINQKLIINTAGVYRLTGMFSVDGVLADKAIFAPYKNDASFAPDIGVTLLGAGNPIGWHYNLLCTFAANDEISIYGSSTVDATNVSILAAAFGIEKVIHV